MVRIRSIARGACAFFVSALSCARGGPPSLGLPSGCQPLLAGADCFLPYPSDFFRVADASMPGGFRIQPKGAAALALKSGESADVNAQSPIDGYSRVPTIAFYLAADVAPAGFVPLAGPAASSLDAATSNTLLIDADTGARIPHFVDLDPRATDPKRRAIVIHPLVQLRESARYVVAVHAAQLTGGGAAPAPEGFRRLRDRVATSELQPLEQSFEERIFPIATAAGIARAELQLAWDFTTGSDAWAQRDMLRVRDLTLQWLQSNTPAVTITSTQDAPDDDVARVVNGTLTMPLFVDSLNAGAQLVRDASGVVQQNGTGRFPFLAQVSQIVGAQTTPGRALAYGHGFFGGFPEIGGGAARHIGQRLGATILAAEWWGMSSADVGVVAEGLLVHPSQTFAFADRVHQAMANWLVLTSAIRGVLRAQPALQRANGDPLFSADPPGYLGISQGAILGGTMVALNADLPRAVLHVGGDAFTHLMMRARPFLSYLELLDSSMPDPLEQQKYIATLQRQFDRFDPASWTSVLLQSGRRVLMQNGLGDTQVPNLGTFLAARMLGIPVLTPSPVIPYGLRGMDGPIAGSALALWDFGLDADAIYRDAVPAPTESPVHEGLREQESALAQMQQFLDTGVIANTCGGVCHAQ